MYHIERLDQRIIRIAIFIIAALMIIMGRLFYLQIRNSDHYHLRGQKNFLRTETTQSRRGNIRDCNGVLLATNRPVQHLFWQGTGNRSLTPEHLQLLQELENIVEKPITKDPVLMRKLKSTERYYRRIKIADDISFEQLSKIEEQFARSVNLILETHFERYYPYGTYASHVLGYLGRHIDAQGQMGLEKLCEQLLKGDSGTILKTINSVGRDIAMVTLKNATHGQDIDTTLDINLQTICESVFPQEYKGVFLIVDPHDGAIKSLVSRPTFDPALFLSPISPKIWQELQEQKPFLNRAFNPYPPGSVFKLISVSAALEHHLVKPDQVWNCRGYLSFAQRRYWCHQHWGHGKLDTMQAVAQSCNILFYEIGKKIDVDILANYAHKFGLGKPTNPLFHERIGIVPSREWKRQERSERWWPGETLSVAIGQSFLMATPIQVARMIGSIFTGYLIKPRLLSHEEIQKEPLFIKPDTINFLKDSMRFVVTSGTGRRVNTVKDIEIYAKTSTAQTSGLSKRELSDEYLEHAWFVAHFTYKDHKPLVLVILVERAGSSQIPTNIAKQFLIAYKKLNQKQ